MLKSPDLNLHKGFHQFPKLDRLITEIIIPIEEHITSEIKKVPEDLRGKLLMTIRMRETISGIQPPHPSICRSQPRDIENQDIFGNHLDEPMDIANGHPGSNKVSHHQANQEYLVDKLGLPAYPAETIAIWNVCLHCGTGFSPPTDPAKLFKHHSLNFTDNTVRVNMSHHRSRQLTEKNVKSSLFIDSKVSSNKSEVYLRPLG
ncbi:hypothetical protein PSHT_11223 [Puccinia striiformis]|uniref:Uncharacterized protein n=1 Tax=Puccinia striiformis TaxID=27350 RepID=A0A2S4V4N1_9BASI|nr:hypothetical protein PSHT_11223 [Puccinia striiformis]